MFHIPAPSFEDDPYPTDGREKGSWYSPEGMEKAAVDDPTKQVGDDGSHSGLKGEEVCKKHCGPFRMMKW